VNQETSHEGHAENQSTTPRAIANRRPRAKPLYSLREQLESARLDSEELGICEHLEGYEGAGPGRAGMSPPEISQDTSVPPRPQLGSCGASSGPEEASAKRPSSVPSGQDGACGGPVPASPDPVEAGLPASLRRDSAIGRQIFETGVPLNRGDLRKEVRRDFEVLVQRMRVAPSVLARSPGKPDLGAVAIAYRTLLFDSSALNAVLRLCLHHLEFKEAKCDDLAELAIEAYRANRCDYDLVLGQFIPKGLVHWANHFDYVSNANPSALPDWDYFLTLLGDAHQSRSNGLYTGIRAYDEATNGLRGLTILAGPTGAGKSTLALNFAVGVLRQNPRASVVFFELEVKKEVLYRKLLSLESGVDYATLVSGARDGPEASAISKAIERLRSEILPRLRVVGALEFPAGFPARPGYRERQEMKRLIQDHLDSCTEPPSALFVVVDGLAGLKYDEPVSYADENDRTGTYRELSDLEADSERLNSMMLLRDHYQRGFAEGHFALLVIARVRKLERDRRVEISDVAGKADIVFNADSVLLLQTEKDGTLSDSVTPTRLTVAKVRDGGQRGDLLLEHHHRTSSFQPGNTDQTSTATKMLDDRSKRKGDGPSRTQSGKSLT
jgi:DnaB-like helicase C terminal domain